MVTNWQQETWSAINHLAPAMPELSEEKHIVQNKDKFKGLWLVYFPQIIFIGKNILHFSFYVVGIVMKGLKTFTLREEYHNVKRPKNLFNNH